MKLTDFEKEKLTHSLRFVLCRQIANRVTTLYQLYNNVSTGTDYLKGILEKAKVEYVLIPHSEKFHRRTTEILISHIPEDTIEAISTVKKGRKYISTGITAESIKESYNHLFGQIDVKHYAPIEYRKVREDTPGDDLSIEEQSDPYVKYRIEKEEFEGLKDQLIKRDNLMQIAKYRGFTYNQIRRAVGEPKMRFKLVNENWRPYVYQGDRYFHISVLDFLYESDKTYFTPFEGRQQRAKRLRDSPDFKDPMKFTSRKELFDNLERLERLGEAATFEISYYQIR